MKQTRISLVNEFTADPTKIAAGLKFVCIATENGESYHAYYDSRRKNDTYAKKRAQTLAFEKAKRLSKV